MRSMRRSGYWRRWTTVLGAAVIAIPLLATPSSAKSEVPRDMTMAAEIALAEELAPASALDESGNVHLSEVVVRVYGHTLTLAHLADAQEIARARDWPLALTLDRYLWQEEFARIATALEETHPEIYAGAAIVRDGEAAWLAFKHEVPVSVEALLHDLPVPVKLVGGRGFSVVELRDAVVMLHEAVVEHPDVEAASTAPNYESGAVTSYVQPHNSLTIADRVTLQDQIRAGISQILPEDSSVRFEVAIAPGEVWASPETHTRGGAQLLHLTNPDLHCTTGFVVRHTDGRQGVATAGHCANPNWSPNALTRTYRNPSGGNATSLTRNAWHMGSLGDVAWYGNHNSGRTFYSSASAVRTVSSVAGPQLGQSLCHMGRATGGPGTANTGPKCTTVVQLDMCQSLPSFPTVCRLARMNGHITADTDSGGPWFANNTAVGIHFGRCGLSETSCFTPANGLLAPIGVMVRQPGW